MPGTLGPSPAGLTSGEPGGATFSGACTPGGTGAGGVMPTACPGSAEKKALARRANSPGSMGAYGAPGTPPDSAAKRGEESA